MRYVRKSYFLPFFSLLLWNGVIILVFTVIKLSNIAFLKKKSVKFFTVGGGVKNKKITFFKVVFKIHFRPFWVNFPAIFGFWKFFAFQKHFYSESGPIMLWFRKKNYFFVTLWGRGVRPECNICYTFFSCKGAAQYLHLCLSLSICPFVLKLNFSQFGWILSFM